MNAYFLEVTFLDNNWRGKVGIYNNAYNWNDDNSYAYRTKKIIVAISDSEENAIKMMENHLKPYCEEIKVVEGVTADNGHGMEIIEYMTTMYPRYKYGLWDEKGKVLQLNQYQHVEVPYDFTDAIAAAAGGGTP